MKRRLVKTYTPAGQQGFLGVGHTARPVIQVPFPESDPFIFLMDDWLDKKDEVPVGGPHPHAGFETVSLLLEGEMGDAHHTMKGGDLQLMTAGRGVVHTETIDKKTKMRLLQLWLTLPKKDRWAEPRLQDLAMDHAPVASLPGAGLRVYSGTLAGVTSPILNHTPLVLADISLEPNAVISTGLPASYTTFLYVIAGALAVGEERKALNRDQVGWLDRIPVEAESELLLNAGPAGCRVILYSGEPQGVPIVSHGPFIADTEDDIRRLYRTYRDGGMNHINDVAETQKLKW